MYDMNEYATAERSLRPQPNRRNWLAVGIGLAAVLVLVVLIAMACSARSDSSRTPLGAVATPTASAEATSPEGADAEGQSGVGSNDTGTNQGGNGNGNSGGNGNGNGGGNGDDGDSDGEDEGAEPEPLSITPTIDTVAPGGQCFASGTIEVSGGEYPVTVYYQWRRAGLDHNGQLTTLPVSAVQNMTFDGPGERKVQTSQLPMDGPNVRIFVTGPKKVNSDWVAYESCDNTQPGDIVAP